MPNPKTNMHPAYTWMCDECGMENVHRVNVLDPQSDEAQELYDEAGEHIDSGEWHEIDDWVVCAHCGTQHQAIYAGDEYGEAQEED